MSDSSLDHAEWAVQLQDGSFRLRCTCGWQDQVMRSADIAAACTLHRPLVPQQSNAPGEGASLSPEASA